MRTLSVCLSMILLAGCLTVGQHVSKSRLDKFQKGVTTYDQVLSSLGKPTYDAKFPSSERSVTYNSMTSMVQAGLFLPWEAGKDKVTSTRVEISFDSAGLLKDWEVFENSRMYYRYGQPPEDVTNSSK